MTTEKCYVLGLDISKDNACYWLLPVNGNNRLSKKYWQSIQNRRELEKEQRIFANAEGLEKLKVLCETHKIIAAGLEPTGLNYAIIFCKMLECNNIPYQWIGHAQVKAERNRADLPNKNDLADAIAIAFLVRDNLDNDAFFRKQEPIGQQLGELSLQFRKLQKLRIAASNKLRQQLSSEFPEAALSSINIDQGAPLLKFLQGKKCKTKYWENRYRKSIARKLGIELSQFTREITEEVDRLLQGEGQKCTEILKLLKLLPENYQNLQTEFLLPSQTCAEILGKIYPIDKFFRMKGEKLDFKATLGGVKQLLGYGKIQVRSGDMDKRKTSGSSRTRASLSTWVSYSISFKSRRTTPTTKELGKYYDQLLAEEKAKPLVLHKVAARAIELIVKMLIFDNVL